MSSSYEPLLIGGAGGSATATPEIAGNKAARLWQVASLGLDVPPAFVLPIDLCRGVNKGRASAFEALQRGLGKGIGWLEGVTGKRFGDIRAPLLVSVRSGAAVSMPGMLETVLNVGLNDSTVHGFIRSSGNPRLAFDSYRRLLQGYGEVVQQVPKAGFEQLLADMIDREGVEREMELDSEALERLTAQFGELVRNASGRPLPDDPQEQLREAAIAVYRSWESPRACEYRKLNRMDDLAGTAVTVQTMVFGNSGARSGAGVAFSRNPATGANEPYVDFLFDAQGEDVVSGRRTPAGLALLEARLPKATKQLLESLKRIEAESLDAQDVEFTVQDGRLYFLQTRTAKRTPRAALRMAVEMVHETLIDTETALGRLGNIDAAQLAVTRFAEPVEAVATAIVASPGVASGRVAFDSQRAQDMAAAGDPVILVRSDTSTEDVAGFAAAAGILTAVGGRTAHASVVARQLGKVCLVGCRALTIDPDEREAVIGAAHIREGDWLSLDGATGSIAPGKRTVIAEQPPELTEVEHWRAQTASRQAPRKATAP